MPLVAYKIRWDTDGENADLPRRVEIPENITDPDAISDYLSDLTGFCHKGFMLREVEPKKPDTKKSKKNRTKLNIDKYFDVTCAECTRSRSTDFEKGMEQDKRLLDARALSEGWARRKGRTLCPDCARKIAKSREEGRHGK